MTPKVVDAAAAGSGANLEMASPGLTQIKWARGEAAPLGWGRFVLSSLTQNLITQNSYNSLTHSIFQVPSSNLT